MHLQTHVFILHAYSDKEFSYPWLSFLSFPQVQSPPEYLYMIVSCKAATSSVNSIQWREAVAMYI